MADGGNRRRRRHRHSHLGDQTADQPTLGRRSIRWERCGRSISEIAELHRTLVPGDTPPIAAWDRAARAARAIGERSEGAERYAVRAAYQSTALIETDDWDTLDAVTGNALKAHRLANGDDGAARILEVTRNAIRSWRRLAGLSVVDNIPPSVAKAVRPKGSAA